MQAPQPQIKPEVMSPAGHWPQLLAAVEAGADAVYFGLTEFTARAKVGFERRELAEAFTHLHRRGVKGYVTFNTLVFDSELKEAARAIETIAEAGADAIIVQDTGIAQLAHRIAPDLPVHGSTQMSITSAEGVEFARQSGVSRVVLGRELSLADVAAIRAATDCELEMFVHGALCVSYSGQCFSSEAWGGRSANRGQCAQACRLPYELLVDGNATPLGDARYLLSPGDLFALRQVPEIIRIGIHALKIEGRYKDANYVALATNAYRKAVDDAWAGRALSVTPAEQLHLEQVYSRGVGPWFVGGTDHQQVVRGRSPRHRGVQMGRVMRVDAAAALIEISPVAAAQKLAPLAPGDGVVFDAADWRSPQEQEEGGRVYQVEARRGGTLAVRFGNGAIDFSRIRVGDLVWRTHSPQIDKLAAVFIDPPSPVRRQPVSVRVAARAGERLRIEWRSGAAARGVVVVTESAEPLEASRNQGLTERALRDQLGRLGNTVFELGELAAEIEGSPFVPVSLLNQLRREAVAALDGQLGSAAHAVYPVEPPAAVKLADDGDTAGRQPRLHLLVRTAEQLEAAIAARPDSITLDYLELYGLRPSVERVLEAGIEARVASPRVLKPSEERVVHFLRKLGCAILVRPAGLLHSLTSSADENALPIDGDFSLNAANVIAAQALLDRGLRRITPTHDLNAAQITALARAGAAPRLEVVAFQHLPVFHTEHCVFCRFLSSGTSHLNCGHPCEKHQVALRDERGRAHPVMADVGCRNTVFNAEAQEASAHLSAWRSAGIRHFRLEFVHQTPAQVSAVTRAFRRFLGGEWNAAQLARELRQSTPEGTTEGSLMVPAFAVLPA